MTNIAGHPLTVGHTWHRPRMIELRNLLSLTCLPSRVPLRLPFRSAKLKLFVFLFPTRHICLYSWHNKKRQSTRPQVYVMTGPDDPGSVWLPLTCTGPSTIEKVIASLKIGVNATVRCRSSVLVSHCISSLNFNFVDMSKVTVCITSSNSSLLQTHAT